MMLLLLAVILITLTACSNDKSSTDEKEGNKEAIKDVAKSGMPIVKDPITLDFFSGTSATWQGELGDVKAFQKYKDMTNIDINWKQAPEDTIDEKRNLALASGSLPDVFYGMNLPNLDILKYGQQDTFIKLNDLIENYAPNLSKLIDENPIIKKAITFPNGDIYTLPYLVSPEFTSLRTFPAFLFNQKWLDALEMDRPETTEEFYQYLKAVKTQDPNGNGKPDEVPYGGPNIATLVDWLYGSFGISNKGVAHIDLDPKEDKVRFYPITDRYKEMMQYMNKLYSERLIAQNIFSIDWNQYLANASKGLYGSTVFYDPVELFGEEVGKDFINGIPLKGPHGDQSKALNSPVLNIGGFAITNENKHPAATVRWADYFYGDEGSKLMFMGVEGETYEETPDGEFEFLDKVTNDPNGLKKEEVLEQHAPYLNLPAVPSILQPKLFKGSESSDFSVNAAEEMKPYLSDEVWTEFTYTKEENKKLSALSADIEKYVNEMRDKFITGNASLEKWDDYVQNIKDMGLDDYMSIQQEAYNRFKDN